MRQTDSESDYGSSSEDEEGEPPPLATRFAGFKEMIREAMALAEEQFNKGAEKSIEKFMESGETYRALLNEVRECRR